MLDIESFKKQSKEKAYYLVGLPTVSIELVKPEGAFIFYISKFYFNFL